MLILWRSTDKAISLRGNPTFSYYLLNPYASLASNSQPSIQSIRLADPA